MLYLRLRLLAEDRDGLIDGLRSVIKEIETARDLDSYVMGSVGAYPQFLLDVEVTDEAEIETIEEVEKEIEKRK